MKLKNLKKKIGRIEARMQKDSNRVTKLKRKLNALVAVKARKTEKKAATRAVARQIAQVPAVTQEESPGSKSKKRNLSPEGRAALSAAMKARWAAKRAAAEAAAQDTPPGHVFVVGQVHQ